MGKIEQRDIMFRAIGDQQLADTLDLSSKSISFPASISANLTGNVTGNLTGNVTGDLAGTASNIPDLIVSTAKIQDGAVTNAKLGANEQRQIAKAWGSISSLTNTSGASQALVGYNTTSIVRGATAGLYTITITAGTFTSLPVCSVLSASNNAGVRVVSVSGNTAAVQCYVGVTATDMRFQFILFTN